MTARPSKGAYDVIVVGIGGMGSAATYQLASRGMRVLALDRFGVPNELGSSHGESRIIRLAYYEDPQYVPLLRRAYELWNDLEAHAGERLLIRTGSVDGGLPGGKVFSGAVRACTEHDLECELLSADQLTRRFPAYRLPADTMVVLQPDGGYLLPERCIAAYAAWARESGAVIHADEEVVEWAPTTDGVRVRTSVASYDAAQLVLTAGAWNGKLVPECAPWLQPERQVVAWFSPSQPRLFDPKRFPVFNLELGDDRIYGFPVHSKLGFKIGRYHHRLEKVDPDLFNRLPEPADEHLLRGLVDRYFPNASGSAVAMSVCMFTNTPDEHFLIGRHPRADQVLIAGGFSGHGFKFCSVVGEALADIIEKDHTEHDLRLFRLDRFERVVGSS